MRQVGVQTGSTIGFELRGPPIVPSGLCQCAAGSIPALKQRHAYMSAPWASRRSHVSPFRSEHFRRDLMSHVHAYLHSWCHQRTGSHRAAVRTGACWRNEVKSPLRLQDEEGPSDLQCIIRNRVKINPARGSPAQHMHTTCPLRRFHVSAHTCRGAAALNDFRCSGCGSAESWIDFSRGWRHDTQDLHRKPVRPLRSTIL